MWKEEGAPLSLALSPTRGERGRSPEAEEFWREVERVRPVVRSGEQLSFYVPEQLGHDDFVTMLALLAWTVKDVRLYVPFRFMVPPAVPKYAPY